MQVGQKKNIGKYAVAILFTGCFMLATANASMAETPKLQLDFTKIQQALNKGNTASDGTAASTPAASTGQVSATATSPTNGMPVGPDMMGAMSESMMNSGIMAEMQKKIMAENMGAIQKSMQASIMQSMQGTVQQTDKDSKAK